MPAHQSKTIKLLCIFKSTEFHIKDLKIRINMILRLSYVLDLNRKTVLKLYFKYVFPDLDINMITNFIVIRYTMKID